MSLKSTLETVGNYGKRVALNKKLKAQAKAIKLDAKGKYKTKTRFASIAKTAIRNVTTQKLAEEETKKKIAEVEAARADSLAKWNATINNKAEPAENTGVAKSGSSGVTVIGNE